MSSSRFFFQFISQLVFDDSSLGARESTSQTKFLIHFDQHVLSIHFLTLPIGGILILSPEPTTLSYAFKNYVVGNARWVHTF